MLPGNREQLNYTCRYTLTSVALASQCQKMRDFTPESCIDVVCYLIWKGDGEIHHRWTWLCCSGGGSWRSVFLLSSEPHWDRWILLTNSTRINTQSLVCFWIQSSRFCEACVMSLCSSCTLPFCVFKKVLFCLVSSLWYWTFSFHRPPTCSYICTPRSMWSQIIVYTS